MLTVVDAAEHCLRDTPQEDALPSSNFEFRSNDAEASFIAVAATLKAICEKVEVHPDRYASSWNRPAATIGR